jgi:hypothetical protein
MEILLIRPSEITAYTPMGGNVDVDKYIPCILDVQVTVLEPLLGKRLYEKIKQHFADENLQGDYEVLFTSYVKPILRHQVFAEYVEIGGYTVANGGIFKHVPDNTEPATRADVQYLAQTQRAKAQMYIERAEKWLRENPLPEYRGNCNNNIKVSGGWFL